MANAKDANKIHKDILSAKAAPPALLITAPDHIRRERAVSSIIKNFLSDYENQTSAQGAVTRVDASQLNSSKLESLHDEIFSMSLFSGVRFFVINNLELLSSALNQSLLAMLKESQAKTSLILCATKLAANSVILKHFQQKDLAIEIPELKSFDLQRWVGKELKNAGITSFNNEVVHSIIQSCESNPDNITALIEKLALYLDGPQVTLSELSQISRRAPDDNEFTLIEMLASKQTWKHEVLLSNVLASGKSPFGLLALLAKNYSNYLKMSAMREQGMQASHIRESLGLPPWLFNKQFEISKRYNSKKLVKCLEAILKADATLKNRSLGAEAIFSELTYQLGV